MIKYFVWAFIFYLNIDFKQVFQILKLCFIYSSHKDVNKMICVFSYSFSYSLDSLQFKQSP